MSEFSGFEKAFSSSHLFAPKIVDYLSNRPNLVWNIRVKVLPWNDHGGNLFLINSFDTKFYHRRDTTVSLKTKPFSYFPFIHRRNKPQQNVRRLPKKKTSNQPAGDYIFRWQTHELSSAQLLPVQKQMNRIRVIFFGEFVLVQIDSLCGRLRDIT